MLQGIKESKLSSSLNFIFCNHNIILYESVRPVQNQPELRESQPMLVWAVSKFLIPQ